jgi:hypothetical protein
LRDLLAYKENRDRERHLAINRIAQAADDAWVEGYESLIPIMENDQKDRHVLAAAALTGTQTIVTFNVKHFPETALTKWNLIVQQPQDFLIDQFYLDPSIVIEKVQQQAAELRGGTLQRLLAVHDKTVPEFTALLRRELSQ